jgi:prepilin signal peptidase PulO-like enzyme (type II secretory pathway)
MASCAPLARQTPPLLAQTADQSLLPVAAELALWQSLGFTLQLVGLHWATATRSAVVLYLNAFLVPLIAKLLDRRTAL